LRKSKKSWKSCPKNSTPATTETQREERQTTGTRNRTQDGKSGTTKEGAKEAGEMKAIYDATYR